MSESSTESASERAARGAARRRVRAAAACGPLCAAVLAGALAASPAAGAAGLDPRLNEVQVLGTHNSYHVQPIPELIDAYLPFDPAAIELEYTHRPLDEQFEMLGIRQIELDVWSDPDGGYYAEPLGLRLLDPQPPLHLPEFDPPGLKCFHIADLDWVSHCTLFVDCLTALKMWSDMHPQHLPIFVLIEVKDDKLPGDRFLTPLPFDAAAFDELDATIRSVFPEEDLITPDFVRGNRRSVAEAIKKDGWPTLRETRGKVLFGLDNGGEKIDIYLTGHPGLAGRVLFTDSPPGAPEAAFAKRNDPIAQQSEISDLVKRGFIVRTRADADTLQARPPADVTMRDAAIASGAQYVSTDYPELGPFGTDYIVQLPGNGHDRCNPVNAPKGCRDDALEFFGDQRELAGRKLTVKDAAPEKRLISVSAKDTLIETPLPGGANAPTLSGGTLEIRNPTTQEEDLFTLPAAGWKGLGNPAGFDGWQYRDPRGLSGPCTLVDVRNGKSLRALCSGAKGNIAYSLDEATQGAIEVELRVGGGDDHCLHFGGTIVKDAPGLFVAKASPAAPCGNGVN